MKATDLLQTLNRRFSLAGSLSRSQPGFFWQGVLILLPAVLMAGVGFYSLRQDRVLAEHQAREEAKEVVRLIREQLTVDRLLDSDLPAENRLRSLREQLNPATDPVWLESIRDRIVWRIDGAGDLIYPPSIEPLPMPEPLEESALNSEQRSLWESATKATFTGKSSEGLASRWETFLESPSPRRFRGLAHFYLAITLERQGDHDAAQSHLERIWREFEAVRTESGLPLKSLAQWRWLKLAARESDSSREWKDRLDSFLAELIRHPTELTHAVMAKLQSGRFAEAAGRDGWLALWDAHEQARGFFERTTVAPSDSSAVLVESETEGSHWLLRHPGAEGNWWIACPIEQIVEQVANYMSRMRHPPYLGVSVSLSGETIVEGRAGTMLASVHLDETNQLPFNVEARLAQPELLYAQQRKRTVWFGSLIALSAVAVGAGFITARRAYFKQQRLSDMKSNFVSSVSHEMRAPIASVRLMAEELDDLGIQGREKNKQYHRYIIQECRRLSTLIENVLDISRHEQGRKQYQFEPIDLAALMEETVRWMQPYAAEKEVAVQFEAEGEPKETAADQHAVEQILVNLVDNAVKHSPAEGMVTVRLEFPHTVLQTGYRSENELQQAGKVCVRLVVEDQGEGIPPEEQTKIFERFYRSGSELRRKTTGVGLGLAIVKQAAEAHGGTVRVESEPGKGSRFIVELPLT